MKHQLLPLPEQVIVITGASSGIGLVTAKRAAHRGARVVLAARNETDLRTACDEIRRDGGRATYVVADVITPDDVRKIAEAATAEFGRIDSWVNVSGHVDGLREALRAMREHGGALVNVAGGTAEAPAIKGFTDSLRVQLEHEGVPISVSLVKPEGAAPETTADVILRCSEKPPREHLLAAVGVLAGLVTFLGFATLRGYARS